MAMDTADGAVAGALAKPATSGGGGAATPPAGAEEAHRASAPAARDAATTAPAHRRTLAGLLDLLDPALDGVAACARCQGARLGRWGTTRRGLLRWRCRDCGLTWNATTGTPLSHLHSLDKLHRVAADMLAPTPRSCRALAAALGLDRMTVWRWRRLIADVCAKHSPMPAGAAAGADSGPAVVLRESRKASREWVRHRRDPLRHPAPDRLRWIDYRQHDLPLPEPMSRYRVIVPLPPRGQGPASGPANGGHAASKAATRRSPNDRTSLTAALAVSTQPSPAVPGDGPATSIKAQPLAARLLAFLTPFSGPATRHLETYLAWFAARDGVPPARSA